MSNHYNIVESETENPNYDLASTQTPNTPQNTKKEIIKIPEQSDINKIAIKINQINNQEQWELRSPVPSSNVPISVLEKN